MKKLLFLYNPHAGRARLKPQISDVVDIFVKAGYEVTVYPTQCYRDGYRMIQTYPEGAYDLVVCGGGDGTIDEVVSGMMMRDSRQAIGYIPTGTVNDFASSLLIPKDILEAADNAVNGKPFSCDVGAFNDGHFIYVAAFGLFTDVSYETNQQAKNMLGNVAYFLAGVTRLFDVPSYQVKVCYEDQVIEDEFIFGMVTNSRSVGGFKSFIGQDVHFDDGLFEVTLIKTPKDLVALQEIVATLLIQEVSTKHMITFQTDHLTLEFEEEVAWTLDGEYGGVHDRAEIQNLNRQLTLMVPEAFLTGQRQD